MPKLSSRNFLTEHQRQVPVVGGLLQVLGDQVGERDLVEVVVLAGRQPRLNRRGGPLGLLGEHVGSPQQLQGLGHYLARGQLLGGLRPVVRYCDPRRVRASVVKGELDQARRGQPA
jgi:hypothetical protein